MKICQINTVYGIGSTGKIVRDLHQPLLENGFKSIAICNLKNEYTKKDNVYILSNKCLNYISAIYRRLFGLQFNGAFFQTNKLISILKKERPDVVHIQCINGNNINIYRLLKYLAKNKIKTIYTLHAEFPYTGGCEHSYDCNKWLTGCGRCPYFKKSIPSILFDNTNYTWKKQKKCYQMFDNEKLIFTAVSPWLELRAKESPMLKQFKIITILNPINTLIYNFMDIEKIKNKYDLLKYNKVILHVTANFELENTLKGGKFVVDLANKYLDENVIILVAANYCKIKQLPKNVIYIGKITDNNLLAKLYSLANVTLITSKKETFSMVTAESLCCGTPVVGFLSGGPESIALSEYSSFVEYSNIDLLKQKCDYWLNKTINKEEIAKKANEKFNQKNILSKYMDIYR